MPEDYERHSAIGIYHYAEDFFIAATQLAVAATKGEFRLRFGDTVPYHLHTHSVELVLKAFLRADGVSNDSLKAIYGHKLERLLSDCVECGLALGEHQQHTELVVRWLNAHGRAETFRYFEAGYFSLPALSDVHATNQRLLTAIRPACLRALSRGEEPNTA